MSSSRTLDEGAAPEAPIFFESLNQVGAASRGRFLRRDFEPAEAAAFWRGGNPNAGGAFWAPLGPPRLERFPNGFRILSGPRI